MGKYDTLNNIHESARAAAKAQPQPIERSNQSKEDDSAPPKIPPNFEDRMPQTGVL